MWVISQVSAFLPSISRPCYRWRWNISYSVHCTSLPVCEGRRTFSRKCEVTYRYASQNNPLRRQRRFIYELTFIYVNLCQHLWQLDKRTLCGQYFTHSQILTDLFPRESAVNLYQGQNYYKILPAAPKSLRLPVSFLLAPFNIGLILSDRQPANVLLSVTR